jgi:hypothetical protein
VSGPPPPQRVPADVHAAGSSCEEVMRLLEATIERASSFTEDERHRRVNDEWSTVESLRHIVMVVDGWLGRTIKGEPDPFHPIGLPPHFAPRVLPGSSIDPDADPTFEEACEVLRGRLQTLAAFVDGLTNGEHARDIGTHAKTVAGGLGVIFDELTFHNFFINRDLSVIEQERV